MESLTHGPSDHRGQRSCLVRLESRAVTSQISKTLQTPSLRRFLCSMSKDLQGKIYHNTSSWGQGSPRSLTAQPTEGADAVHLHPEASSPPDHRLPAPPPHFRLSPQEVEEELGDLLPPARQSPHSSAAHSQSRRGRRHGGSGVTT